MMELLVTLLVVGVLTALVLPYTAGSKERAKEVRCTSNLKQTYSGFLMYQSDNGRFPAGFLWRERVWTSAEFFGGKTGWDTNVPPAQARPLYPYLGESETFRCPADLGIYATNKGGFWEEPSLFAVYGLSYRYNGGHLQKGTPQITDGLGGKKLEWVQRPSSLVLVFEPPANGGAPRTVYWHRARKPGTGPRYSDEERGPRISPFLFVDGHVKFYDCSGCYVDEPNFPGKVEFAQ